MSTDLSVPDQLVDPRTGELHPATPDRAAELIVACRNLKQQMDGLIKDCTAVFEQKVLQDGKKTFEVPAGTVVMSGGPESELVWDIEVLDQLRELGLPEERFNELVKTKVIQDVDARVAKQLEAANPEYAGVINVARARADRPWRVSIR